MFRIVNYDVNINRVRCFFNDIVDCELFVNNSHCEFACSAFRN